MKKILLCGVLLLFTGQAFAAKKGKGKAKETDLTSQFFDVIAKSFTLNPRKVIDDSNFKEAINEVQGKILTHLPEEMANKVDEMLKKQREMQKQKQEIALFFEQIKDQNALVKSVFEGKQKTLKEITQENLLVSRDNNPPVLFVFLLSLSLGKEEYRKHTHHFLKMLFESEAAGNSTLLADKWSEVGNGGNGTLFKDMIEFGSKMGQEVFLFPLFAELIKKGKIDLSKQSTKSLFHSSKLISFFDYIFGQYSSFILHNELEDKLFKEYHASYVTLLNAVIEKKSSLSEPILESLYDFFIEGGVSSWKLRELKEKKISEASIKQKQSEVRQATKKWLEVIIKNKIEQFDIQFFDRIFDQLLDIYPDSEFGEFSEYDKERAEKHFELIDLIIAEIKKLKKDVTKEVKYSKMLHDILGFYVNKSKLNHYYIKKDDKRLLKQLEAIIKDLVSKRADINYRREENKEELFNIESTNTILFDAILREVPLKFYELLIDYNARLADDEKGEREKVSLKEYAKDAGYNIDNLF